MQEFLFVKVISLAFFLSLLFLPFLLSHFLTVFLSLFSLAFCFLSLFPLAFCFLLLFSFSPSFYSAVWRSFPFLSFWFSPLLVFHVFFLETKKDLSQ